MKKTKIYKMEGSEELIGDVPEECAGADVIIYEYQSEPYQGSGTALIKKDGQWYESDLGHCSCYGPLDALKDDMQKPMGKKLTDLLPDPIVDFAKSLGYK